MAFDPLEIRRWAADHRAAWELIPLIEMHRGERVQVGYTLNLYAQIPVDIPPSRERQQAIVALWDRLREIAESLVAEEPDWDRIEVSSFDAARRLRPENQFVPEVMLEARIVHASDYFAPVSEDERRQLRSLEDRLRELGLRPGHW